MLLTLRACALAFPTSPRLPNRRAFARKAAVTVAGCLNTRVFPWTAVAEESDPLTTWKTSENIFAQILRGEAPAVVLDDSGELFSFVDKNPASTLHYLVIPRRFIRDASDLRPADAQLVRDMEAKARQLVRDTVGDNFDESELALGFHWPPWYSVPWLHLHAIYPRSSITRWWKYTQFSFYPPERVLRRLEQLESSVR